MAKCVLAMTGQQATTTCDNLNICASLQAGIEGAVHMMGNAWREAKLRGGQTPMRTIMVIDGNATTTIEELGQPYATLLVDTQNGFNKLSQKAVMWTIQH